MKFLSTLRFCSTLAIVALCANFAMAANNLYVEDLEIAPGETKSVNIILVNDDEIHGIQGYILFPEGITPIEGTVKRTSRMPGTWPIDEDFGEDVLVMAFDNETNDPIMPGSGPVLTVDVVADNSFQENKTGQFYDLSLTIGDLSDDYQPEDSEFIISCAMSSGTPLATINASGEEGQEYTVADNLTIMATVQGGLLFATDGAGEWIKILSGDFADDVANMQAFAAGTTKATYNKINGNGQLTLNACPEAGNPADLALTTYDLSQPFAPKANEVINIIGYFYGDVLRGYAGLGQSASLNLAWCTNESDLMVGKQYKIDKAIVQLKEAWKDGDGAPRRINPEDYDYTFQNYEIYPTVLPDTPTAIEEVTVANDAAEQWIDLGGRLLNQQPQAAGIYIRIANGKAQKVVVK